MPSAEPPPISYDELVARASVGPGASASQQLIAALEDAWLAAYWNAYSHESNVLKCQDQGFTFLFDQVSATGADVEDRLIVGYGWSTSQARPRDVSRMRGFLRGRFDIPGKGTFDKGHVLAHGMGGGLDVNLFPQRAEVNRGRSAIGKIYGRMERYATTHPGTFVFSRLWYSDSSWVPGWLEYGILLPEGKFWVERFKN